VDTQVLVVGAGIAGTVLALELAHHGVSCVVVERSTEPSSSPRVHVIDGRSMELLRRLGLSPSIRERAADPDDATELRFTHALDQPPILIWQQPSAEALRERYASVNDGSAPAEPHQRVSGAHLKELLREAAHAHPLIDLRRGWILSDLHTEPHGATATVVEAATAVRHPIRAGFVAGCDGERSAVRFCLGVPMEELGVPTHFCSVEFTSDSAVLRGHGSALVTAADHGLTLVRGDGTDRWSGSMPIPPDQQLTADPIALIKERLGVDFAVNEILDIAYWRSSLAVAARYRKGPTFLLGDAAHQFWPGTGYGMNTTIADAVDLGWKLAATIQGWGGSAMLDSYEAERRPVALFNQEMCARLLDVWRRFSRLSAVGVAREQLAGVLEQDIHQVDNLGVQFGYRHACSPIIWHEQGTPPRWRWREINASTWPGGRAPAVRLASGAQLFDQLSNDYTLVDLSGRDAGGPLVEAARLKGYPLTHLPVDDPHVRACWDKDLVLVRPDHFVAWRGDSAPGDWAAVLDRVTGRLKDPAIT
jgi:2-polyprenyl-6-methoxyphenol hydroxylase-like FAD-dependent oxidoreductase